MNTLLWFFLITGVWPARSRAQAAIKKRVKKMKNGEVLGSIPISPKLAAAAEKMARHYFANQVKSEFMESADICNPPASMGGSWIPRKQLAAQLEAVGAGGVGAMMPKQERMAWLPYLSDRADGVKGHYAIARWNPRGYQEVWNLWSHKWSSASEDVLTLEQATEILHRVMMPVVLQAVQESAQVHAPIYNKGAVMNEETLAGELLPCPLCGEVPFLAPSIQERNTLQRAAGWKLVPLEPTTEMLQAGQDTPVSESDEDAPEDYKAVYRAMLAAAPHPQQIAGLEKDAEIAALKAERDALRKDAEWYDCKGWYAIEEADLDADMQEQAVL